MLERLIFSFADIYILPVAQHTRLGYIIMIVIFFFRVEKIKEVTDAYTCASKVLNKLTLLTKEETLVPVSGQLG